MGTTVPLLTVFLLQSVTKTKTRQITGYTSTSTPSLVNQIWPWLWLCNHQSDFSLMQSARNVQLACTYAHTVDASAVQRSVKNGLEMLLTKLLQELQDSWVGYSALRERQQQIVKAFVPGQDVFVALPTGSGKSLCFCILPAGYDILRGVENLSLVVVVSPLMKGQVEAMSTRGVSAAYAGNARTKQLWMLSAVEPTS